MHYFLIVGTASALGFCLGLGIAQLRNGSTVGAALLLALAGMELGLLINTVAGVSA